ncbi:MAG: STN domain-containing protein, partial [Bacteroidota bacterium]
MANFYQTAIRLYKGVYPALSGLFRCLVLSLVGFLASSSILFGAAPEYISYSYREESLEEVLEDLERRYELNFVYSQTEQLVGQTISARSGLVGIDQGLQILFAETAIEFRRRDARVLLRYNQQRAQELLSLREIPPAPEEPEVEDEPIIQPIPD